MCDIPFLLTAQASPRPWVASAFSNTSAKIVPEDLLSGKVFASTKKSEDLVKH